MVVCPNCSHQNPEGATQCEACYTPLPTTTSCPHCGATIQTDASFCGQCGSNLQPATVSNEEEIQGVIPTVVSPPNEPTPEVAVSSGLNLEKSPLPVAMATTPPEVPVVIPEPPPIPMNLGSQSSATQLQQQTAKLIHVQTSTDLELPQNVSEGFLGDFTHVRRNCSRHHPSRPICMHAPGYPRSKAQITLGAWALGWPAGCWDLEALQRPGQTCCCGRVRNQEGRCRRHCG